MMNGYKTFLGLAIALAPTIVGLFGYHLTEVFAGQFSQTVDTIMQIVGLIFAAYGRMKAESPGWLVKNPTV